jgi:hypothetical protein
MVANYPSFAKLAQKQLSVNPDVSAVLFTYMEGSVLMSGFGIAAASGQAVLWRTFLAPMPGSATSMRHNCSLMSCPASARGQHPALRLYQRQPEGTAPSAKPQPEVQLSPPPEPGCRHDPLLDNFRLIHPEACSVQIREWTTLSASKHAGKS